MNARFTLAALISAIVGTALCLAPLRNTWSAADNKQPNRNAVKAFMHGKLNNAQDVLDGLVNENYEKIRLGADAMKVMSQKAEWNVMEDEVYQQYSQEFRGYCEKISKAAKDKNVDAATLAYVQLTITCVSCHKFTRGVAVADLGPEQLYSNR